MKKYILLVLILTAIFIAGCSSGTSNNVGAPYIGGTKGLEMKFTPGAPPSEIYDNKNSEFGITVEVRNVGETDLDSNDGYVQITGISADEFGVSANDFKQDIPEINGARKNSNGDVIQGSLDVVSFEDLAYQQDLTGNLNSNKIRAIACYNYATKASADVCVKEDAFDGQQTNSVCSLSGSKPVANSGGPLQVTGVTQNAVGKNKIQVVFSIAPTLSTGDLFFKKDTECDDKRNNPDLYKVFVTVDPIVNGKINADCSGFQDSASKSSGYITLYDATPRTLTCTFDTSGVSGDFTTRANIELEYRYMQYIEQPLLIKDVSTNN